MQRLLAALITALLSGSLTTRIEHNLRDWLRGIAGELGNSIIGGEKHNFLIPTPNSKDRKM